MNDLSNCGLTSLDVFFSRLRPRTRKKGFILKLIVFSSLYPVSFRKLLPV